MPSEHVGNQEPPASGMEVMASRIRESCLDSPIAEFICQSIRKSSARTYESVWKSWHSWSSIHGVDCLSPSSTEVIRYLWFLFQEKRLAAATLGVHQGHNQLLSGPLGPRPYRIQTDFEIYEGSFPESSSSSKQCPLYLGCGVSA